MFTDSVVGHLALFVFVALDLWQKVIAEYCGDNKYCQEPYKCCVNSQACCYDDDSNRYTRGFKLHVWNMWYFWLVIIFILMSCFGGCGYYRRRRLAALQQSSPATSPARTYPSRFHRRLCRPTPSQENFAYAGPEIDGTPVNMHLPPPYTEVMQQPGLYPVNKMNLPPYPGPPDAKDAESGTVCQQGTVNPPPYSEVAQSCTVSSETPSPQSSSTAQHSPQPSENCRGSEPTERHHPVSENAST